MKFYRKNNLTLDEEAVNWLVRFDDKEPNLQPAFSAWLQQSPRHVRAYLSAATLFRKLDLIDPQRRIAVKELIAHSEENVLPLRHAARFNSDVRGVAKTIKRPRIQRPWLIAAGTALFAVAGWFTVQDILSDQIAYQTEVGEQREIKLDDHSIIHLNTRSRVQVRYTERGRDIRLLDGEALFTVAHDPHRPFRVVAGTTTIRALGTEFNVYRHSGTAATVTVVEGLVQIDPETAPVHARVTADRTVRTAAAPLSPTLLAAGEEANVRTGDPVVKRRSPDMNHSIAWRKRELVFRDQRLSDVAAEFNRYNKEQITVDDAIRNKQISGIFGADYPQSLILFLQRDPSLTVERSGGNLSIRERYPK